METNEYIPYHQSQIVRINPEYLNKAAEKFKNAKANKEGKILGFAAQWQIFEDLVKPDFLKEDVNVKFPEDDYSPYDIEINNDFYDVKLSINGNTITVSEREIKFADDYNTRFICLSLCDTFSNNYNFEYLGTIDYLTLEEHRLLRNSKYDYGCYFFISDVKRYFK